MSSGQSFYLLEPLQSFPVVEPDTPKLWLGRIVSDYRCPVSGYTPDTSEPPAFKYHSDAEFSNVTRVIDSINSASIQLSLLDILGVSKEDFKSRKHTFKSRKVERWRLHQDADVLEEVLRNPEVERKLEEWDFGFMSPLYFVVGLLVTEDIAYHTANKTKHKAGGFVDPMQATALAGGVPLPFSAKIGVDIGSGRKEDMGTHAKGMRVFAVEYRTFRKRLVQRSKSPQARLKGYGPRGDRSFTPTDSVDGEEEEAEACLDPEPFTEIVEGDAELERCFDLWN